jgi:hypothetical protein
MHPSDFDESNTTLEAPEETPDEDVGDLPALQGGVTLPSGARLPVLATRWTPTEQEREAIANGADVYLHVVGDSHPIVMMATDLHATRPATQEPTDE